MQETEKALKNLIISRYGNLNRFCCEIGMSWTTLDSILKRGVLNANIKNILMISHALNISVEDLTAYKDTHPDSVSAPFVPLTSSEQTLLADYRSLNNKGRGEAWKRVHELTEIPQYTQDEKTKKTSAR